MHPHPPHTTLFPYTTLFRSIHEPEHEQPGRKQVRRVEPARERRHRRRQHHAAVRESGHRDQEQHPRSEEHTSELQSPCNLVCRLLLEKKKTVSSPDSARSQP